MRRPVLFTLMLVAACGGARPVDGPTALRVRAVVGARYRQTTTLRTHQRRGESVARLAIERRVLAIDPSSGVLDVESVTLVLPSDPETNAGVSPSPTVSRDTFAPSGRPIAAPDTGPHFAGEWPMADLRVGDSWIDAAPDGCSRRYDVVAVDAEHVVIRGSGACTVGPREVTASSEARIARDDGWSYVVHAETHTESPYDDAGDTVADIVSERIEE